MRSCCSTSCLPALALALILWLLSAVPGWAEAWPRGEGNIFLAPKVEYYETATYWNRDGNLHSLGHLFRKVSFQDYVEYGLTAQDTLSAKISCDFLADGDDRSYGLADLEIGYRRSLLEWNGLALSAGLLALIPGGYSLHDSPQLGYSRFGLEPSLALGHGWTLHGLNGFAEAIGRVRFYQGYPSDQLRGSIIIGQDVSSFLQFILESELQWGLDNGNKHRIDDDLTLDTYYRLFKMTLHGRIKLTDNVSFVLSGFQHIWGVNTGAGGGAAASLWLEF